MSHPSTALRIRVNGADHDVSAAIANAIFDATGARVRQVPFTPDRVREAVRASKV